ncbi:phosphate ABC transporter substrate-binding protein [Photobacterium kishitanii]|uniref:Phosphate-binding protein n=1 Tax=Photobacterium kishitanii TaxID=318456 RepID=A0A2T3R0B8_9GAMM|nr:phosphate ABC transporter substrate-binding protein [Photobacterium kishitanii]KJG59793.1 phosphate ABC transporter substrate-binding protein [Photobacterium kishitanii]KJG63078.1 phosphate ABC transporter substrate-binding protein [Photobacterium kishitanii]KJG67907.1 phosphate ABC transporter substrate-binding protein [Photobacterium kishitanii]KJG71253.1 phosphate ABC transporter substrate-binding protein [Photobacterium kishitanii]OBU27184.1 phosphate ABC transporter substrate-binding p
MLTKATTLWALCTTLAFSAHANDTVTVAGSTSVSHIMDILAEHYSVQHPDSKINVQGISSSAGIVALQTGTAEIGMSSRIINANELDDNYAIVPIAHDGIALVVNPTNPVNNITHSQIDNIYHGVTRNWQQVGGNNEKIAVVSRENASGSRFSFEHFMKLTKNVSGFTVSDINPEVLVVSTNGMVKSLIARNQQAIGYLSFGSVDNSIKPLSYDGVIPNLNNIRSGEYKIARPFLIMYKKQGLSANAEQFIKFLNSDDAKKIINANGYIAEQS